MERGNDFPPLIVIVGPTASGKSALAIGLAERFHGEIIAADSRTIYCGMDVGTAKPTESDRRRVQHHLLDITTPDKPLTVADFKGLAQSAIGDIAKRGKLPIMVGGTGLYIDSVIYDFSFRPKASDQIRRKLQKLSVQQLQKSLLERGIPIPTNSQNPRHLVRSLETGGISHQRHSLRINTLLIGLAPDPTVLKQRIEERVKAMLENGLVDEVRSLVSLYGWSSHALQTPGYKAIRYYLEDGMSLAEATGQFVKGDIDYAKRQMVWFKRNESIHWLPDKVKVAKSVELITTLLSKSDYRFRRCLLQ